MSPLQRAVRAAAAAAVALAVVAAVVPAVAEAQAAPLAANPSTGRVVEATDWSSAERADPLDFDNAEDLSPIHQSGVSNVRLAGGAASFQTTSGGYVEPVYQFGIIPHGPDSTRYPINGDVYTRVSVRMNSTASSAQPGGLFWFKCWEGVAGCASARSFTVLPGWHTYTFDMKQQPNLLANAAWDNGVTGLRIVPSGSTSQPFAVDLDWVRIHQPGSGVPVTVSGGAAAQVWWDTDTDLANNGTASAPGRGAGVIATNVGNGASASFDAAAMPPGTYRFYSVQNGQASAYSQPLVIAPRPQAEMISPSITTGADYATTVRGDPWDFSQPTDVQHVANFTPSFGGGVLTGFGSGALGDPNFEFSTAGLVDAARFHKLTFTVSYDGPFGLHDGPGGGMNMRLIWGVDNGSGGLNWYNGQDVVVTPGWQTISYDLRQDPGIIQDETDQYKAGWGGIYSSQIRVLRFDPHEDSGGRTWAIDDVKLTADDVAQPSFTFQYADRTNQSGTTAEIWLDGDRVGMDGTRILSNLPVAAGTNRAAWSGGGVAAGTYWPVLVLRSSDGAVTKRYATGQLVVLPPPVDPFGSLDSVTAPPGKVGVSGWTIDPDDLTAAVPIHVYADGRFLGAGTANGARGDIASAFPGAGPNHGFDLALPASAGAHDVCTWAINAAGSGGNTLLGCRRVTVRAGAPVGSLDAARGSGPGQAVVAGWTIDPDTTGSIPVHVYVNGGFAGSTTANGGRSDIASAFPGYGADHGFQLAVPAPGGASQICAYAINSAGPDNNALLGCTTVNLPTGGPVGVVDVVQPNGPASFRVAGWTLDPDTADPVPVHVYVNGTFSGAIMANGGRSDIASAFPGYGADHGYALTVSARAVDNQVCAYAINAGPGGNALLGCSTVRFPVDPIGSLDAARRTPDGKAVVVSGWSLDRDTATSNEVHVYVDGRGFPTTASIPRPDVAAAIPGWGQNHGYQVTVPVGSAPVTLCAYSINTPGSPGGNTVQRCVTV